jgi:hypothetical protein
MVGGLVTNKRGEESLRSFAKEAFVKENLPYIMGTISLLMMILATVVSSATAAGTVTMETSGSGSILSHTSFSWSEMPVLGPEGASYHHDGVRYNYNYNYNLWPEEPPVGNDLWTPGPRLSPRYYRGWYNQQPVANDLLPNLVGPTIAGSSVTWTAKASDPDGDALLYKFWLKGPSTSWAWRDVTGWTASNLWTWKTTLSDVGTSQVCVSVKDGRHPGPDGSNSYLIRDYTVTLPRAKEPPAASNLLQSPAGPINAGSSVTWTAKANDPDRDQIYYRFWLKGPSTGNSWKDMTGWTASNRWTMQTTQSDVGTNQVNVWIRDGKHAGSDAWDSYQVRDCTVISPRTNEPPTATGLVSNRGSPQVAGSSVTWTATANDIDGDQIYYRFWLKGPSTGNSWKDVSGWTTNSQWTWWTSSSDVGASQVNVWIRDGKHAGADGWDSYQVRDFTVIGSAPATNQPPTAVGLAPNKDDPRKAGMKIKWTADVRDPEGDPIYYRFWLKGPSTGNNWKDMTGWTASNRWTWQTTASDVGTSSVNVWIRDGMHAGPDAWDSYQVRDYTITW